MPKIGFKIIFVSPLPSEIINCIKYVWMILHIFAVLLSIGPLEAGSSNQGVALAAINLPSVWPRIQVFLGTILYWSWGCCCSCWRWWGTNIRSLFYHINLSCLVICIWLHKISRNTSSILQTILTSYCCSFESLTNGNVAIWHVFSDCTNEKAEHSLFVWHWRPHCTIPDTFCEVPVSLVRLSQDSELDNGQRHVGKRKNM